MVKLRMLKTMLHVLLVFLKPTNNVVVKCSQHLDEYIVKYQKIYINNKKGA